MRFWTGNSGRVSFKNLVEDGILAVVVEQLRLYSVVSTVDTPRGSKRRKIRRGRWLCNGSNGMAGDQHHLIKTQPDLHSFI